MTYRATVVKIFLASPSDTANDRHVVRQAADRWNAEHGEGRQVIFQVVGWETHTSPEFGDEPQAIINRQALDGCDALISLLWTTLGSPTKNAKSGTVEEIYRFAEGGKPVGLFFCDRPLPANVDTTKLGKVRTFRDEHRRDCLYETYTDEPSLDRYVGRWLTRLADDYQTALGARLSATPAKRLTTRLTARLTGSSRSQRIEVRNGGTGDVHDVKLSIPDEVKWLSIMDGDPIAVLRPGEAVKLMCSKHFGGGPQFFDMAIDAVDAEGGAVRTQYSKISN